MRQILLVVALSVLLEAGCSGLTEDRVAQVRPGATTKPEVLQVLGRPTLAEPATFVYLGRDGRQAVVCFDEHGVVTETRWWPPAEEPGERSAGAER